MSPDDTRSSPPGGPQTGGNPLRTTTPIERHRPEKHRVRKTQARKTQGPAVPARLKTQGPAVPARLETPGPAAAVGQRHMLPSARDTCSADPAQPKDTPAAPGQRRTPARDTGRTAARREPHPNGDAHRKTQARKTQGPAVPARLKTQGRAAAVGWRHMLRSARDTCSADPAQPKDTPAAPGQRRTPARDTGRTAARREPHPDGDAHRKTQARKTQGPKDTGSKDTGSERHRARKTQGPAVSARLKTQGPAAAVGQRHLPRIRQRHMLRRFGAARDTCFGRIKTHARPTPVGERHMLRQSRSAKDTCPGGFAVGEEHRVIAAGRAAGQRERHQNGDSRRKTQGSKNTGSEKHRVRKTQGPKDTGLERHRVRRFRPG